LVPFVLPGIRTLCEPLVDFTNSVVYRVLCNVVSCGRIQFSDLIIPTIDTARQSYFLNVYLSHEVPLLFVGPTGTGKTVITSNYLLQLPKERSDLLTYLIACIHVACNV